MHCQVTLTVENNEGLVHLHYAVVVHQRSKKTIMLWPNWCTVESADETMTLLPALKTRVLPPLTVGEQGLCCPVSCYQYVWHHSNAFNSFWYFFLAQMKQKMESGTILMCIRGCSEILPAGRWSEMRSLNMVMVDSWLRKNLQLRTIHMS